MSKLNAMSTFAAFWIGLALLLPVLGLTLVLTVFAADPSAKALPGGLALALPPALAGAIVAAWIADTFGGLGGRTWLAVGLTLVILSLSFVLLCDWMIAGVVEVRDAAAAAIDKDGFYLTRQLFVRFGGWALLLLPVLILTLVLDSVVLVFIPLFHPPFWGALALLLLRGLGWIALGGGLSAALSAGLLKWQENDLRPREPASRDSNQP